jgi:hypothetical protein
MVDAGLTEPIRNGKNGHASVDVELTPAAAPAKSGAASAATAKTEPTSVG